MSEAFILNEMVLDCVGVDDWGACVLGWERNSHLLVGILALLIVLVQSGVALEEKMGLEFEWVFNTSAQFPGLSFGAGHMGPPTAWDIDGDGVNEILWGTRRGHSKRLWCLEGDGSFKWIYLPIDQDGLPGDPTQKSLSLMLTTTVNMSLPWQAEEVGYMS